MEKYFLNEDIKIICAAAKLFKNQRAMKCQ